MFERIYRVVRSTLPDTVRIPYQHQCAPVLRCRCQLSPYGSPPRPHRPIPLRNFVWLWVLGSYNTCSPGTHTAYGTYRFCTSMCRILGVSPIIRYCNKPYRNSYRALTHGHNDERAQVHVSRTCGQEVLFYSRNQNCCNVLSRAWRDAARTTAGKTQVELDRLLYYTF